MARVPKPKLPKPKKSIGQHIKDNTRKAAASGLRKNFGILGEAVAKKYLSSPRTKANIRIESDTGDKKINSKKLKKTVTPDVSILESAKQLTDAFGIVAGNVTRGFARTSHQVDTMGEEVSKSLNELGDVLDRMLYRKPAVAPSSDTSQSVPHTPVEQSPVENKSSFWGWLGKSALARLLGLAGIGYLAYDLAESANKAQGITRNSTRERIERQGKKYNWWGKYIGDKPDEKVETVPPPMADKKQIGGNENIIHKMKYSAEKIKFVSTGKIEFKSKISNTASDKSAPSSGFFNRMVNKVTGGPGGSFFGGGTGGSFFSRGGSPETSPNSTPNGTPAISKPDIDYSGPDKGAYDSHTGKANYMQPNQYGAPGSNIISVKTAGGHSFQIHSAASEAFRRTIEDLEQAGMPLGTIGGYSPRPGGIAGTGRMSQHSMGNAMDIGSQSARDVITPQARKWIEEHPKQWREILDRNGMVSGGDWKNPDLGHIEWSGRKPWEEKKEEKTADKESAINIKPTDADATPNKDEAAKFGNIIQSDNDALEDDRKPITSWHKSDWNWMRPMDNFDTNTGDKRFEDRRDDPNPMKDDEYSRAAMEEDAYKKLTDAYYKTLFTPVSKPSSLDIDAGAQDLDKQIAEQEKPSKLVVPPTYRLPPELNPQIPLPRPRPQPRPQAQKYNQTSYMQDTEKEVSPLDHRPRQDAIQQQDFSSYTGTVSGSEDVP